LPNVPITGELKGIGWQTNYNCNPSSINYPTKQFDGKANVVFSIGPTDVKTYSQDDGSGMVTWIGGNPNAFATRIAAIGDTSSGWICGGHPQFEWRGVPFSFSLPQSIKETGGNFEFKVSTIQYENVVIPATDCSSCPANKIDCIPGNDGSTRCLVPVSSPQPQLQVLSSVYIEPQKCIDNSYVTYEQVFKQGSIVRTSPQNENEVGFRIENPTFCHSAPILKQYQDSNQVFEQSNTEYDLLNNGSSVTVPNGQQWVMFYRGLPAIDGALQCQDNGGVWNATDNRCELPPTLWFVCNGILTQERDCVVQTTDYRCKSPTAVLETQPDGSFICHEYFDVSETTYNCPTGSELKELPTGIKYCEYQPELVCNGGEIVNGHCVIQAPPAEGGTPTSGAGAIPGISTALIVVIVLIIGGLAIWYIRKKK
jgi:hypothetical protein